MRKIIKAIIVFCITITSLFVNVSAGEYKEGYWGNTVLNKHIGSKENITLTKVDQNGDIEWENVAYCFNVQRGYPVGKYDGTTYSNEYEFLEDQSDSNWKSLSENSLYSGDMKDILTKIIFIGYPYDSNDGNNAMKAFIKEKCKVDDDYIDDVFRAATQKAIWHITDKRPFRVPSGGAIPTGNVSSMVSEFIAQEIFQRATAYTGNTGLETRLWKWSGANNRNQHLLDTGYNTLAPVVNNKIIDVEIPISKSVKVIGDNIPNKQSFNFSATPYENPNADISSLTITGLSVDTDGENTYNFVLKISGKKDDLVSVSSFKISEINTGSTDWKYDDSEFVIKIEEDTGSTNGVSCKLYKLLKDANGGSNLEITDSVEFVNEYGNKSGNLVITKTLEGEVADEEAKAAIEFKVTAPDGTSKNYKLNDFDYSNGKYTLELNDVLIGEYTVEETKKDINGKSVTVTYKVNAGQATEGTEATAEVVKGETTTVDFNNNYENKKGKLVITKTIEGDVTEEEAEGAITFKVTGPDGKSTTYTLDKFTKGEDGKYTLTLEDVVIGEYTVEETTKDVDGKNVTVTYSINSGTESKGDKATSEVEEGQTSTVDFKNSYENKKGKLVITKTIEGDVTEEEAEGAITFKVTGPDGTSTTYTLDKFTKGEDGKYTLTLEDVVIGEYTVEETTKDVDGKNVTVTYTINSGDETEGDSAKAEVTEGNTTTVEFNNNYELIVFEIVINKVTAAGEELPGATLELYDENGTLVYTNEAIVGTTNDTGSYKVTDLVPGRYKLVEAAAPAGFKIATNIEFEIDKNGVCKIINGMSGFADDNTITMVDEEVKPSYLVITKTIKGDATADEVLETIKFKVTAPDSTVTEYELSDFVDLNGVYTLRLDNVQNGDYTIEEIVTDIEGKTLTVSYSLNSNESKEGNSLSFTIVEGETVTVDFNNSYENKKGKLVITKTIEGDVTEEEAEGAITFKVTGPNDFEETYTLNDFENEDGKYTLTLEDVVIGEYTVEETTKDVDGKNVTVTYTINSGDETEGDSANAEVTEGNTTTVDFNNSYENKKGKLVITKTIEGDVTEEEAEGAITFKVTGPDGTSTTYTLDKFTKGEDGKYILTLEDVVIGEYTVEETTKDVDGKNVTVTYTINSGDETEGDSANAEVTEGNTTTVDFNNSYENKKGKLVITKTIEGDVTEEEAEGAITFKVTGPDGTSTTYTLDKFTKGEDGKYTLTLEDVVIGEYTVEETTKDVDGKNVTVTYTINSGDETEGDSAKAGVTEGNTTTVDFNNSYENKKGKLVITKTIEGDVTEEEAEGAITFKVTGPDGTSTTYTLDKFTKGEDGKYTLTLEDVVIGEYTVEETTKDVDGKNVTVTYKINSGTETSGDKATAKVTEGETTTVDFNNSYENKPKKDAPNTGDNMMFVIANTVMVISLSLLIAVIYVYKRLYNM